MLGLFGQAVIGQIAAKQENVGRMGDFLECVVERAARMFAVMNVGRGGDADFSLSHCFERENGCALASGRWSATGQCARDADKIDNRYARALGSGIVLNGDAQR